MGGILLAFSLWRFWWVKFAAFTAWLVIIYLPTSCWRFALYYWTYIIILISAHSQPVFGSFTRLLLTGWRKMLRIGWKSFWRLRQWNIFLNLSTGRI